MNLFFVPENIFFTIAIAFMILMICVEAAICFIGHSLSEMVESLLPELGLEDGGPVFSFLKWLRIDELPYFETFIVFFGCFGLGGVIVQTVLYFSMGSMLHPFLASIAMLFLCLPIMRIFIGILADKLPGDGSIHDLVDELKDKFQ